MTPKPEDLLQTKRRFLQGYADGRKLALARQERPRYGDAPYLQGRTAGWEDSVRRDAERGAREAWVRYLLGRSSVLKGTS